MSEKEKLLKATVDLRPGCIKQLTTKQGTEGIKELLKTGLWEGEGAALSIVHKLNEAAIIESSKWMLTGKAQEVNIKASNVWPGANETLIISFMCDNLEEFEMEDMCCISKWRTIRYKLQKSRKSKQWKRNVWCVCTLAFMGSFRIHELLCRYTTVFSSERELMAKQVKLGKFKTKEGIKEYLEVFISHPKEEKLAQGIKIEVHEVKGKECWACPVAAWKDMKKRKEVLPNRPLITREDGRNYTGTEFNRDLKAILEGEIDYKEGKEGKRHFFLEIFISSH